LVIAIRLRRGTEAANSLACQVQTTFRIEKRVQIVSEMHAQARAQQMLA
jgi:hypothetical protein